MIPHISLEISNNFILAGLIDIELQEFLNVGKYFLYKLLKSDSL